MFFLESPYKWGKGWTSSNEDYESFKKSCFSIIEKTEFVKTENRYDVPEGIGGEAGEKCYLHPMELYFKIKKDRRIEDIIEIVKDEISKYGQAKIIDIKIKDTQSGEFSNVEIVV